MSEIETPAAPQIEVPTAEPQAPAEESFQMPEKFVGKSAEEIAKSYVDLEKYKGSSSPEPKVEIPQGETPSEDSEDTLQIKQTEPVSAEKVVEDYGQKFLEQGNQLYDEDFEALAKIGYPRGVVEQYIRGQVAESQQQQATVTKVLGGDEQTQSIMAWAADNLSKAEIESMNQQLTSNPEVGAAMLKLKYEAEVPQSGNHLRGNGAPVNNEDVFHSQQEVISAMSHPDYNKGGAYDLNLKAKIGRSIKAGKIG